MAKRKWYGSINNRLEEGHNYNDDKLIHEGDDLTMYYWSDSHAYFVTKVINQKHIFVHKYHVCADHSKEGGMGHQNWLYFKTSKEEQEYINKCIDDGLIVGCEKHNLDLVIESPDEEWMFRYNHWNVVNRVTPERWQQCLEMVRTKDCKPGTSEETIRNLANWYCRLSEDEIKRVEAGETIVHYCRIQQSISFGIKRYYYDWEF